MADLTRRADAALHVGTCDLARGDLARRDDGNVIARGDYRGVHWQVTGREGGLFGVWCEGEYAGGHDTVLAAMREAVACAFHRAAVGGAGAADTCVMSTETTTTYALISNHNGPCSVIGDFADLRAAIEAARTMDTDSAPTELEDHIEYDGSSDRDDHGLIAAAEAAGWVVVASAGPGEYWTVMSEVQS